MEDSSTFMKPNIDGFRFIERYLGITNPGQIHFFDDKAENIKGAKDAGWNGHLVANDTISQIDEAVSSSCSSN
ncbi:hypothetical protein ECANGB1_1195 [Enterospora canceri]|uniref:Uncharacterized protein n=1 Tax=Enterospora canceri TaxID=1081671 RepID=A0A1Y1S782_9MICR|nr:hypothetical protein ECANGB1_1195 [Enterospora canceri]